MLRVFAMALLALSFAGGCGLRATHTRPPDSSAAPPPSAAVRPPVAAAASSPSDDANRSARATAEANISRYFASDPDRLRYTEEATPPPGEAKLDNAKARQFSQFAYPLAQHTLKAAQDLLETLDKRKLPDGLKPVVLTAVMDPVGRLTEIVIVQHSGDIAVDRLVIEACKKGLWVRNPPEDARASDGNYRLRIDGTITNHTVNWHGYFTYTTQIGLSIL
jgi:hypothetical protein